MYKRTYQIPAAEVVELQMETRILTGSPEVTGNASLGGLDDGGSLNDEW